MKSQGLQNARIPEAPQRSGPLRPLSDGDFRGINSHPNTASPALLPFSATQLQSGGRFRQIMDDRAAMQPLADTDRIPGVKLKPASQHAAVTEQAQKWVAQTFFGTLMKQMHDSPFKSELFSGGRGGEAFQTMMDQHLVEKMSRSAGQKLVRGLVRQIEGREAYRKQAAAAKLAAKSASPSSAEQFESLNGGNEQPAPKTPLMDIPKPSLIPRNHVAPSSGT